jgi:hypothetical protein
MPYKRVNPEVVFTYKNITIYHIYKDGYIEEKLDSWFTTDIDERPEYEFSIPAPCNRKEPLEEIFKKMIDEKKLKIPED